MKVFTLRWIKLWGPSLLRGGLWVSAAVLNAYVAGLQVLTDEEFAALAPRQSRLLYCGVVLAGVLAWRTYIDSSHQTQKTKAAQDEPNRSPKPSYVAMAPDAGQPPVS